MEDDSCESPTRNITSRRRVKKVAHSDSEEDQCPSPVKKRFQDADREKARMARHTKNVARAERQLSAAKKEQQALPASTLEALMAATYTSKILISNCFEQKTVLDVMNADHVNSATINDMSRVLIQCTDVYGMRVDKALSDTKDTRISFARGVDETQNQGNSDQPTEKAERAPRKKKNLHEMDWQSRINELINGESEWAADAADEMQDDADVLDVDEATVSSETLNCKDDIDSRLQAIKDYRKQTASKVKTRNLMIEEDSDRLTMPSNELSENDYYQKAVSRYGLGTAASLLMHNARSTGDGRAIVFHKRVTVDPFDEDKQINLKFLSTTRELVANAFSQNPTEVDILPVREEVENPFDLSRIPGLFCALDESSDDEEGNKNAKNDCELNGTILPDRTILDCTMANMTMAPFAPNPLKERSSSKSNEFSMRNRNISEMQLQSDPCVPSSSLATEELQLCLSKISLEANLESQNVINIIAPDSDLRADGRFLENSGLDDDLRDLDALWNSVIVKKMVSLDDSFEVHRRVGVSDKELKKRRILPPGSYTFFMQSDNYTRVFPSDPWSQEGAQQVEGDEEGSSQLNDFHEFMDAADSFNFNDFDDDFEAGANIPLPGIRDVETNGHMSDLFADSRNDELHNNDENVDLLHAPCDDVPDVPAAPDAVLTNPNPALRHIGKVDDSHWKGNQQVPTKPEKAKKDRKIKQEAKQETFMELVTDEERAEALSRFKACKPQTLVKPESAIFQKMTSDRKPNLAYAFENFTKSGLLFKCAYGGVRFERSKNNSVDEARIIALERIKKESADEDDLCTEWVNAFGTLRFYSEDYIAPNDTFHSFHDPVDDDRDLDDLPEMALPAADADDDSYHSAMEDYGANPVNFLGDDIPSAMPDHFNDSNDDSDADSDDDETGDYITMLSKKIKIKNLSVDQSKLKSHVKSVVTNQKISSDRLNKICKAYARENTVLEEVENGNSQLSADSASSEDFDPLEVTSAIFSNSPETSQATDGAHPEATSNAGGKMSSGVIVSNFDVQGDHTLTSLLSCLSFRQKTPGEKVISDPAMLFSICLQMCNENNLELVQNSPQISMGITGSGETEDWMSDFIIRNAARN